METKPIVSGLKSIAEALPDGVHAPEGVAFLAKMPVSQLPNVCTVKLVTEAVLKGTLVAFNAYEILLEQTSGERVMLYKHAILYITSPALKDAE